jgi:lipoprotein-anchoring transpeptidase ErfK/SrfK
MKLRIACLLILCFFLGQAEAAQHRSMSLNSGAINAAYLEEKAKPSRQVVIKAEVLLGRAGFSPGAIDGIEGDSFRKALTAFQQQNGLAPDGELNNAAFAKLAATFSDRVITEYEITENDVRGPFQKVIPSGLDAMAKLARLSYTGPREALAEKFHISETLIAELNPGTDFRKAGTRINIANVERSAQQAQAAKIVIDKRMRSLSVFNRNGDLVAFYPASVGSKEKPAPSGEYKVKDVERNPTYHYDPKFAFKGVKARHKLTVQPGPNNPVGLVWIGLTAPSYGIHGTPVPENVGKTESHGCVRLTNWDALELAAMVNRGTVVDFQG